MSRLSRPNWQRSIAITTVGWGAVAALLFLWHAISYRWLNALFAEWQFFAIGRYYPALTYLLLVVVFFLPIAVVYALLRRRRPDEERRSPTVALRSATRLMRLLLVIAAAFAIAALATLVTTLFETRAGRTLQKISLSDVQLGLPAEGATELKGETVYARTAGFAQNSVFIRRDFRFAPIVTPGTTSKSIRYFVEVPKLAAARRNSSASYTGILRKGALPSEVERLYRYVGYRVETPHYVLFASSASARWAGIGLTLQLTLASVILAFAGLFQRRHVKRLRRKLSS